MPTRDRILTLIFAHLILWSTHSTLNAQPARHGWNGVILKERSARVHINRDGLKQPMFKWGISLYENDIVETDSTGNAEIDFSLNKQGNNIILGPATKISIARISNDIEQSIYLIKVLQGKLWITDQPLQSRKVQVSFGKNRIIPFGGEYIVSKVDDSALVVAVSGKINIFNILTGNYSRLQQGEMVYLFKKTGEQLTVDLPEALKAGFHSEKTAPYEFSKKIIELILQRFQKAQILLKKEALEASKMMHQEKTLIKQKVEREARDTAEASQREDDTQAERDREILRKRSRKFENREVLDPANQPQDAPNVMQDATATPASTSSDQKTSIPGPDKPAQSELETEKATPVMESAEESPISLEDE